MASSHRGRVKLFAQKTVVRRATKFASVAALALTAVAPSIAEVGPRAKGLTAISGVTDISARRAGWSGAAGGAALLPPSLSARV